MISIKQVIVFLSLLLQVQSFTVQQPLSVSSKVVSAKQYRFGLQMSDGKEEEKKDLYDDEVRVRKCVSRLISVLFLRLKK